MDKVVLTAEQEREIKNLVADDFWSGQRILEQHTKGWESNRRRCLNELNYIELKTVLNDPNSYVVVDETATIKNEQHLNHPFYKKVDEVTAEVARGQILKGAEKYDEPFNPKSWTGKEKAIHLLQELRDAQVYGVGMLEHIEELEEENERLKSEIENLNFSRQGLFHTKDMLSEDNKKLREKNGDLENEIATLKEENEGLKGRITRFSHENRMLKEENKKSFAPHITVNLNGNIDPDFDGAKVAEQLAEQIHLNYLYTSQIACF